MFLFKCFMVFNRLLKAYFQGFEISVFSFFNDFIVLYIFFNCFLLFVQ